jgi:type I restriction enzyme S subunit
MKFDTDSLTITDTNGLPLGWTIGNIENLIGTSGLFCDGDWVETKDQNPKGGVRLIQLADVGDGFYRDKSSRFLTKNRANELNCTFLQKGDLLIARLGVPLGKACIFPGDEKIAVTAVDVCIIRNGNNSIPHKWLMYSMISPTFRSAIAHLQSGTTRKRISRKNLARIKFPIPPQKEQSRIVSKVEELLTKLEAGIESLKQVQTLLKKYRQSVLKSTVEGKLTSEWRRQHKDELEPADKLLERILKERKEKWENEQIANFTDKVKKPPKNWEKKYKEPKPPDTSDLPELPEGWVWVKLEQLGFVIGGLTKNQKRKKYPLSLPYLRVANVYADELKLDDVHDIGVTEEEIDRVLLKKNDLLVVEGNGSKDQIGRVALWDDSILPCVHQNHIIKVRLILPDYAKYVIYWLLSFEGRNQITHVASSTSGLYTLSLSKVSSLPIPLAPLKEQKIIIDEIENLTIINEKTEQIVSDELKRSKSLRQSILKKAFEGKLVPQDPNDEPASVLLERIKAEKLKTKKSK